VETLSSTPQVGQLEEQLTRVPLAISCDPATGQRTGDILLLDTLSVKFLFIYRQTRTK